MTEVTAIDRIKLAQAICQAVLDSADEGVDAALAAPNGVIDYLDQGETDFTKVVDAIAPLFRTEATAALEERVKLLEEENQRAWRERNVAYAKVKAWEAVVYVEGLPLRAVRVDEWGPGEGEQTTVPELTPKRLVDLLDRLAALERDALNDPR